MQLGCGPYSYTAREHGRSGALHTVGVRGLRHTICALRSARPTLRPALGPGGGKEPEDAFKKIIQATERHAKNLIDCITPKHEGDLADVSLILLSTLTFMWLAAAMYRLYAFAYFASGQQTIGSFWGGQ